MKEVLRAWKIPQDGGWNEIVPRALPLGAVILVLLLVRSRRTKVVSIAARHSRDRTLMCAFLTVALTRRIGSRWSVTGDSQRNRSKCELFDFTFDIDYLYDIEQPAKQRYFTSGYSLRVKLASI